MIDRKQLILIIIVGVIALLFFVLVVISAFLPKNNDSQEASPTPIPEELVIPTSSQSLPTPLPKADGVQLISINPPDGFKDATIVEQIYMSFSSPMNEKQFYYKVDPQTSTFIHTDGEKVVISPEHNWPVGKNTITVFDASRSVDGIKLATPFQYTFEVQALPTPEPGIE